MSPADGSALPEGFELTPRDMQGANQPPAEPTPYELVRNGIDDWYDEVKLWMDGAAIENEKQADAVSLLIDTGRKLDADADAARIVENEPHDKAKAEVQARYAPLIADTKKVKGKTVKGAEALKASLTVWLNKVKANNEAKANAAAQEEERLRLIAVAAAQAATPDNLEAIEVRDAAIVEAKDAKVYANYTANDKAQAKGGSRAIGLRTVWRTELVDRRAAVMHFWQTNPEAFEDFVLGLGRVEVTAGKRDVPGFKIYSDQVV